MQNYPKTYKEANPLARPFYGMFGSIKNLIFSILFLVVLIGIVLISDIFLIHIPLANFFGDFVTILPYLCIGFILSGLTSLIYPKGKIVFDEKGFVITKGLKKCSALWSETEGIHKPYLYTGNYANPINESKGIMGRRSFLDTMFIRTNTKDSALLSLHDLRSTETGGYVDKAGFIADLESLSGKECTFAQYHLRSKISILIVVILLLVLTIGTILLLLSGLNL